MGKERPRQREGWVKYCSREKIKKIVILWRVYGSRIEYTVQAGRGSRGEKERIENAACCENDRYVLDIRSVSVTQWFVSPLSLFRRWRPPRSIRHPFWKHRITEWQYRGFYKRESKGRREREENVFVRIVWRTIASWSLENWFLWCPSIMNSPIRIYLAKCFGFVAARTARISQ